MIRRLLTGLVFLGYTALGHAAFDIEQLMTELARNPGGHARFVEKRHLALLDKPVVATGEMFYNAPDRLEKRTYTPKAETMVLYKDTLSLERGRQKMQIQLSQRPEVAAFVESIRSTLQGNRASLERNYTLQLAGNVDAWELTLVPIEQRIATLLQRITLSGVRQQVLGIEYLQTDGDRTEMTIEPVKPQ
ncbi:acyltransferase [Hydrogenophaga sp. Root209]|uniref:LolA-related protein n=1 Tax=unclassified Hydrogenophaga TaxID=2610897 RepID=UPI00070081D5|nr:LolA-related protein [Hydrogenophaga sp. Root209]KRC11986.1 acyltransferase [Hydrogenophaga sp. Root209]